MVGKAAAFDAAAFPETEVPMERIRPVARIHTDFPEKFGIPRQSGIIEELKAEIVFEKEFRDPNCVRFRNLNIVPFH